MWTSMPAARRFTTRRMENSERYRSQARRWKRYGSSNFSTRRAVSTCLPRRPWYSIPRPASRTSMRPMSTSTRTGTPHSPVLAQREWCHLGAAMRRRERARGRCLRLSMRRVADSRAVLPGLVPWVQRTCQAARRAQDGAPPAGTDGPREQSWRALLKKQGFQLRTAGWTARGGTVPRTPHRGARSGTGTRISCAFKGLSHPIRPLKSAIFISIISTELGA